MTSSPILVLVAPQDIVNIASAVRIAKNFGVERMRLVQPEIFDAYRIEGIAHNTADLVDAGVVEPQEAYMKAADKAGLAAGLKAKRHDVSFLGEG